MLIIFRSQARNLQYSKARKQRRATQSRQSNIFKSINRGKSTRKMAFQPTPADISVIITAASASRTSNAEPTFVTERRVTPSWTLMQLKGKLETMTGVPPGCQTLKIKVPGRNDQWMEGDDRRIEEWGLMKGVEIEVCISSLHCTWLFFFCFFLLFFLLLILFYCSFLVVNPLLIE